MHTNNETLIEDLTCYDICKCQKARQSLVAMGISAVPTLEKALGDKREWVRWEATKALSQIGYPAATDPLIKALQDKDFGVRWLAAEGLITIGNKVIVQLLKALVDNPTSKLLQEGAHHILHHLRTADWDETLKTLIFDLEETTSSVTVPLASRKALDTIATRNPARDASRQ